MSLEVRLFGDTVLREISAPVDTIDDELRNLAEHMIDTMIAEEGIGLAAPQVGRNIRMLVVDGSVFGDDSVAVAYINPIIVAASKTKIMYEEGCLSIPDIRADVERPEAIQVRYTNIGGEEVVEELEGLHARVLQHELDHLDGILFVDRISAARRNLLRKKLREIQRRSGRS